ncbi:MULTISPECIES: DUF4231 domain-containing protein [Sphingomonas]|uniref:DUF4231 domain-containing protein n=1 Tax=Sphingomonas TaxID=13687 RepID=UPI000DEF6C25|nr:MULTISPECIES: DUF4231 domain-containing protein [Sphingomonas]
MSEYAPVPFALAVGITGHRRAGLGDAAGLRDRLTRLIADIEGIAGDLHAQEAALFAPPPPILTLVSPLASGADQMAAAVALERGWRLQAVLPFDRASYAETMDQDEAAELDRLVAAAGCVLELPGEPERPLDGFVMAGRATIAHSDLLIAIWDGELARGRGGTAETVDAALLRGTPVIHLPTDPDQPVTLLWSAFDPVVVTSPGDRQCGRPADAATLRAVLSAVLLPPADPPERQYFDRFRNERLRLWRWRVEYPLLMTLAGTRRISRRDLTARPQLQAAADEWDSYRLSCADCHGVGVPLDLLQRAYVWSDGLASHFAQTYRSSLVFNFLLAAFGALVGLSGLVLPTNPLELALIEAAVVLAVIVNTQAGSRRGWHQRWLDYRQLAERLRPMRSLKLLGIAAPDPPGNAAEPVARRWIDWYAAAVWRTIGCPAGRLDLDEVQPLAAAIAAHELQPQVDYNRHTSGQVKALDERLEWAALAIFAATLGVTLFSVGCLLFDPPLLQRIGAWSTVLSAGLPALGTAIFGIRVQGDFGSLASRARNTADQLERIVTDLKLATTLPRTADLTEQAARVMLADLGEWRLVNELHELSLG